MLSTLLILLDDLILIANQNLTAGAANVDKRLVSQKLLLQTLSLLLNMDRNFQLYALGVKHGYAYTQSLQEICDFCKLVERELQKNINEHAISKELQDHITAYFDQHLTTTEKTAREEQEKFYFLLMDKISIAVERPSNTIHSINKIKQGYEQQLKTIQLRNHQSATFDASRHIQYSLAETESRSAQPFFALQFDLDKQHGTPPNSSFHTDLLLPQEKQLQVVRTFLRTLQAFDTHYPTAIKAAILREDYNRRTDEQLLALFLDIMPAIDMRPKLIERVSAAITAVLATLNHAEYSPKYTEDAKDNLRAIIGYFMEYGIRQLAPPLPEAVNICLRAIDASHAIGDKPPMFAMMAQEYWQQAIRHSAYPIENHVQAFKTQMIHATQEGNAPWLALMLRQRDISLQNQVQRYQQQIGSYFEDELGLHIMHAHLLLLQYHLPADALTVPFAALNTEDISSSLREQLHYPLVQAYAIMCPWRRPACIARDINSLLDTTYSHEWFTDYIKDKLITYSPSLQQWLHGLMPTSSAYPPSPRIDVQALKTAIGRNLIQLTEKISAQQKRYVVGGQSSSLSEDNLLTTQLLNAYQATLKDQYERRVVIASAYHTLRFTYYLQGTQRVEDAFLQDNTNGIHTTTETNVESRCIYFDETLQPRKHLLNTELPKAHSAFKATLRSASTLSEYPQWCSRIRMIKDPTNTVNFVDMKALYLVNISAEEWMAHVHQHVDWIAYTIKTKDLPPELFPHTAQSTTPAPAEVEFTQPEIIRKVAALCGYTQSKNQPIQFPLWFIDRVLGVNVDPSEITDAEGNTLLHIAINAYFAAISKQDRETSKCLIATLALLRASGSCWDMQNNAGQTAKKLVWDYTRGFWYDSFIYEIDQAAKNGSLFQKELATFLREYEGTLNFRTRLLDQHITDRGWLESCMGALWKTVGMDTYLPDRLERLKKSKQALRFAQAVFFDAEAQKMITQLRKEIEQKNRQGIMGSHFVNKVVRLNQIDDCDPFDLFNAHSPRTEDLIYKKLETLAVSNSEPLEMACQEILPVAGQPKNTILDTSATVPTHVNNRQHVVTIQKQLEVKLKAELKKEMRAEIRAEMAAMQAEKEAEKTKNKIKMKKKGSYAESVSVHRDIHWYHDNEINGLLKNIVTQQSHTELLTAMLGTDWQGGNTLREQLIQFHTQRAQNISQGLPIKDNIVVPVNLGNPAGEGIHWVLLYIKYQHDPAKLPQIIYVDPLGNEIPPVILESLRDKQLFPNVQVSSNEARLQQDGYNCGPWVIAATQFLLEHTQLDSHIQINVTALMQNMVDMDIHQVRQAHSVFLENVAGAHSLPMPFMRATSASQMRQTRQPRTSARESMLGMEPISAVQHIATPSVVPSVPTAYSTKGFSE